MVLDLQAKEFLESMAAQGAPPLPTLTVEQAREGFRQMQQFRGEAEEVKKIENHMIRSADGEFKVRTYTPEGTGPFPILVYFHGGGYVVGDLELVDRLCRSVTNQAQTIVISVDYRLAPEHKYPTALNDGYAAVKWAYSNAESFNGDPKRIAVGGDSAGGSLGASLSLKAKRENGPHITAQVLIYPMTDFASETESFKEFGTGYNITAADIHWFNNHYLTDEVDIEDEYVSPLRSNDLSNLPPALILTAEYDPLRDDGALYAEKLKQYGNQVEYKCYEGMIHGFAWYAGVLDRGKDLSTHVSNYLKEKFY